MKRQYSASQQHSALSSIPELFMHEHRHGYSALLKCENCSGLQITVVCPHTASQLNKSLVILRIVP